MHHLLVKSLWAFFIALFLTVQGLTLAHAATNGDADHTHEGIACDVVVTSVEQAVMTPPADLPTPAILPMRETGHISPTSVPYLAFAGRAPPLRGPPH